MVTMNDIFKISIYLTDKLKDQEDERRYYFFSSNIGLNKITLARAVSNITDLLTYSPTAKKLLKERNYLEFIQDEKLRDSKMTFGQISKVEVDSKVLFFIYVIFLSYFRFFDYRKSDNYTPILKHFKQLKFCTVNQKLQINEKVNEIILTDEEEDIEHEFFNRIQATFQQLKEHSVSEMLSSIQTTYDEFYHNHGAIEIDDTFIYLELNKFSDMDYGKGTSEKEQYGKVINLRNSLTEEDFNNIKRIIDDICTPRLAATYVKRLNEILKKYYIVDVWDEESIQAAKRDRSKSNVRQLEEAVRIKRFYPREFENIERQHDSQLDI